MTYTQTHIPSEDLAKIGQIINAAVNEASKTAYEAGYQECLGDVVDFLVRVRDLPDLAHRLEEIFDNPVKRNAAKAAKTAFAVNK